MDEQANSWSIGITPALGAIKESGLAVPLRGSEKLDMDSDKNASLVAGKRRVDP